MYKNNQEYFLCIAKNLNISKAASELFVSQPYLSRYLKQLEASLEAKLFERTPGGLKMTSAGEAYLSYVEGCKKMDKQFFRELDEINAGTRGHITMGLHIWRSSIILPDILPSFLSKYPDAAVNLYEGSSTYLQKLLLEDKLDFCIMNLPVDSSMFDYELLMREKIFLAASPQNPIAASEYAKKPVSQSLGHFDISLLNDQTLILMKSGEQITSKITGMLDHYNVRPSHIIETANQNTALNLAEVGIGFTFVPQAGIHYKRNNTNLLYFTIGNPILTQTLVAVYRKNTYRSKLSCAMLEEIKQKYERWVDDYDIG